MCVRACAAGKGEMQRKPFIWSAMIGLNSFELQKKDIKDKSQEALSSKWAYLKNCKEQSKFGVSPF